jgi:hypothetical protein
MKKKIIEIENDCHLALQLIRKKDSITHEGQITKLLREYAAKVKQENPELWKDLQKSI